MLGNFQKGLTLVELIVVIAILGILLGISIAGIDPITQLNKSNDVARQHDIQQMKVALDAYFSDRSCYPTTFTFGTQFSNPAGCTAGAPGCVVYMKTVPTSANYAYVTDATKTCPQWNILFSNIKSVGNSPSCQLQSNCIPAAQKNWACTWSGTPPCTLTPTPTP